MVKLFDTAWNRGSVASVENSEKLQAPWKMDYLNINTLVILNLNFFF